MADAVVVDAAGDTVEAAIVRLWARPLARLPVCKDLPRLCKRIRVVRGAEVVHDRAAAAGPAARAGEQADADPVGPGTAPYCVAQIVTHVARLVERPEVAAATEQAVSVYLSSSAAQVSEMQLWAETLLAKIGNDSSATVRVLKAIHQNAVMAAMEHLRETALKQFLTKDVREARGWTVDIEVMPGNISVTHKRVEQTLQLQPTDPPPFEVSWELRTTFDDAVSSVQAVLCRVTDVRFLDTAAATPTQRDAVMRALGHGSMLV